MLSLKIVVSLMLSVNHHVQSYSYPQCESDKDVVNQRKGIPDISDKHRFHWLIDGLTVAHAKNFEMCNGDFIRPHFEEPFKTEGWQDVEDRPTILYSAYYELRKAVGGPAIRLVGSGLQAAYNDIGEYHCLLWYDHLPAPLSGGPVNYDRIYPSTLWSDMWVSHFILCPLPGLELGVPYAVSIVPTVCAQPQNHVYVQNRNHVRKGKFAYCYPTIYNRFKDWKMFIEMIEMNSILGAEDFTIYRQYPSKEVDEILKFYEHKGKLNYLPWDFPDRKLLSNVMCQRATLNDCLYRNMHVYDYVIISDLDEVFVPRLHDRWDELMNSIDQDNRGIFMFQHAYHKRNKTEGLPEPVLITQTSLWRTDKVIPEGKIRCKSLYRTERALKIDLHFAYQMHPGVKEYMVPETEAMLHHYRVEPMETFKKYPERYNYMFDEFMYKYGDELKRRYLKTLDDFEKK